MAGTKRRASGKKPRRILLYCGADPTSRVNSFFFLNLFWKLMMLGRQKGFEMIPFMDDRPTVQTDLMPDDISSLLRKNGADGIVGIMLFKSMVDWMEESGLPYVALSDGSEPHLINSDHKQLLHIALKRLKELKCKSMGFMMPDHVMDADLMEFIEQEAEELNLRINYGSVLVSRNSAELNGYNHFRSLWKMSDPPEGLVVYPDITARGVITAIVEQGIQVPQELKLICHRNEDLPYASPFPCDWLENSGVAMAEALISQLECQWKGDKLEKQQIPFRLIKGSKSN